MHKVYVQVDLHGNISHVSCDCERNPPPPEEAVVLKGLFGKERKYTSCTQVADQIRSALNMQQYSVLRWREEIDKLHEYPALTALVQEAAEVASKAREERTPTTKPPSPREAMRQQALRSLAKRLVLPAGWSVRIDVVSGQRVLDTSGHSYKSATFATAPPGVTAPLIAVFVCPYVHGSWVHVANYIGRGRWKYAHEKVEYLSQQYDSYGKRGHDRKTMCGVCGVRVTTPSTHVKSKRHIQKVEAAVFDVLEQIGKRFYRPNKEWKNVRSEA